MLTYCSLAAVVGCNSIQYRNLTMFTFNGEYVLAVSAVCQANLGWKHYKTLMLTLIAISREKENTKHKKSAHLQSI